MVMYRKTIKVYILNVLVITKFYNFILFKKKKMLRDVLCAFRKFYSFYHSMSEKGNIFSQTILFFATFITIKIQSYEHNLVSF